MYEDKKLTCKECGSEFVFTAGEQEFYAERGFQNEPQRCKTCRDARKNAARGPREFFTGIIFIHGYQSLTDGMLNLGGSLQVQIFYVGHLRI